MKNKNSRPDAFVVEGEEYSPISNMVDRERIRLDDDNLNLVLPLPSNS